MKRVTGWLIFLLMVAGISRLVMAKSVALLIDAFSKIFGNLFNNTIGA